MKKLLTFVLYFQLFLIGELFSHDIFNQAYKTKIYEIECPEMSVDERFCYQYEMLQMSRAREAKKLDEQAQELEQKGSYREASILRETSQDYKSFVEAFGDFVIEEDNAIIQGRIIEIATYSGSNYKDIWAINDRYLKKFNNFCFETFDHHEGTFGFSNFGINYPYKHCKTYHSKISQMTPVAPNHENAIAIIKEKNLKEREYNQKLKEIKNEVENLKNELKNSNKVQYKQVCSKKTVDRRNINTDREIRDVYHICEMVRVKTKEERIGDGIGYMIGKILNN